MSGNYKPIESSQSSESSVDLDFTDKSLIEFRKNKSISATTTISDIKSSKIGELYDVKPIYDNIQRLCNLKLQGRSIKEKKEPLPKNVSKSICHCLFEKNSKLRIAELEKRIKNKEETPASSCISILDKHSRNHK